MVSPTHTKSSLRLVGVSYIFPAFLMLIIVTVLLYRLRLGLLGFGFHELLSKAQPTGMLAERLLHNISLLASWLSAYLSWPVALVLSLSWLAAWVWGKTGLRLLAILSGLWMSLFVLVASWWAPRYVLPGLLPAIIIMAWGIERVICRLEIYLQKVFPPCTLRVYRVTLYGITVIGLALLSLPFNKAIWFNPQQMPVPSVDRWQYLEGPVSGYGVPEAAAFFNREFQRTDGKLKIVTLTGNEYGVLLGYLMPDVRACLHQLQIVDGVTMVQAADKIATLRLWLSSSTDFQNVDVYVFQSIVDPSARWSWTIDWDQAFPKAEVIHTFYKPDRKSLVVIRRIETQQN